jgi:flagellar basal-body rod protein FlgB
MSVPALRKSLDASAMRGKAISNNLANVLTPGYQRVEVSFESELRRALNPNQLMGARTDSAHFSIGRQNLDQIKPTAYRPKDPLLSGEINDVDVDMEAAKLSENQLFYQASVKFIVDRYTTLKSAIAGRGM